MKAHMIYVRLAVLLLIGGGLLALAGGARKNLSRRLQRLRLRFLVFCDEDSF